MSNTSRTINRQALETQARTLGIDLASTDLDALAERVASGLDDIDRLDELQPGKSEPAVGFESTPMENRR